MVPRHTSARAPYLCRQIHPGRSSQKSLRRGSRQERWAHNLREDSAAVNSLYAVEIGGEVLVRVHVECGRRTSSQIY